MMFCAGNYFLLKFPAKNPFAQTQQNVSDDLFSINYCHWEEVVAFILCYHIRRLNRLILISVGTPQLHVLLFAYAHNAIAQHNSSELDSAFA